MAQHNPTPDRGPETIHRTESAGGEPRRVGVYDESSKTKSKGGNAVLWIILAILAILLLVWIF